MIHERHKAWLLDRRIDPVLAEKFGLETVERDGANWLATPYVERGQIVNRKYRLTKDKRFMMDKDGTLCLWNHDVLLRPEIQAGQYPVIITEGEMDALAAVQCGFENCLSVPNGAAGIDAKLEYIDRAKDVLKNVKTFILATDGDEAGMMLQQELARRLGPARCKFITYPPDCKDLNEVLWIYGSSAVTQTINSAKPYPVRGIYRMGEIPERPPMQSYTFGVPGLSELISIVPGSFAVMTGYPGHGKTSLTMAILANLMKTGMSVAVASFETFPKPMMQKRLRCHIMQCGENQIPADTSDADKIIEEKLVLLMHTGEDDFDIEHLLDLAATAVLRDGIRLLLIDPWNEIEHKKDRDETETEYVGRAIRELRRFAIDYDVAVWLVAHPAKPDPARKLSAPGLSSISGSANFANKADYGLSSHRPNKAIQGDNTVQVAVTKVRMGFPGKEAAITLQYDWRTSTYSNIETGEIE